MLRVAIVGCGKIADQHVHAIRRIRDCGIVAVCDQEPLMAQQLAERFKIPGVFSNAQEMLKTVSPDVVHITTPPRSHYTLARECLEAGSHVYLEKPFTVTGEEAESLIELAEHKNIKITAGHNLQFTLEMLEMRRLMREGFVGGEPAHLESHFSYDLGDPTYAKGLLQDQNHWVRKLPGGLLHNIISHGVAKLAEFLDDDITDIIAIAGQSPRLKSLGDEQILDELRVLLRDKTGRTASFCFSTQLKGLNQLRLFGPEGSIVVDHISGTVVRNKYRPCKSYLTYFVPPIRAARQHLRNARINITNFVRQRLHQDSGMKELIERLYNSIRSGSPPPIPYREIILTARIMDEIFVQIHGGQKPEAGQNTIEARRNATAFDIPLSVVGHQP
ncbi:MAG TPA: Gfo/Idh/MocA family oxidoreductase [Candidatus Udaeobacter sp.]|nr:Gfo/Idh/MocA family oxidoreductase [Candidatus Udaeobacter sp.]